MLTRAVLVFLIACCCLRGHAQTLRTCIPDHANIPFSTPRGEAAGQRVVAQAAQRHGYQVLFAPAPWPRCLAGIQSGEYDLILGVEPDQDLYAFIAFPERGGQVNVARRLGTVDYVLVQKSSSAGVWDFQNQRPPTIVVPRSIMAVRKRLSAAPALIKSINYDADRFVSLLCQDRAEAVVLRRNDLAAMAAGCAPDRGQLGQPHNLASISVYLGVRKSMLQAQPNLAETLWREVDRIRASTSWPSDLDGSRAPSP